jgi:hypothetical protein
MNMQTCEHKKGFIGKPVGYVPTHWECVDCGASMTSGEMIIYMKISSLEESIQNDRFKNYVGLKETGD